MAPDGDWLSANREMWDERVPLHVASRFYDVEGFRAGKSALRPFEIAEMGDVTGKDLVHLQCHFGLDTLSWARLGANVAGLDFSDAAVAAASTFAGEEGIQATFVAANVYDAAAALGGRTFDIVYTGLGALVWLPDIPRWAGVVASLLKPGGFLYLSEFHPFTEVFAYEDLSVKYDYFLTGPMVDENEGTYADETATTEHNLSYQWMHPLGDVVTSLIDAGLRIEFLHEHDFTLYRRWPFLELDPERPDHYRLPQGTPRLPLIYSLRAGKG